MITFNPDDIELPITTTEEIIAFDEEIVASEEETVAFDEESTEETTVETTEEITEETTEETTTPDDSKLTDEAFKADRVAEMKTGHYPFRVKSTRYAEIQKCLKEHLKGANFDYNVYLSCVGCTTCEQTTVQVDHENQTDLDRLLNEEIKSKEEKLRQNIKEQSNVDMQNIKIIDEKSQSKKDVKKEEKQIESELERMTNELQRLTDEKHKLTDELMNLEYEIQKKYNRPREYDENHILSSFRHEEDIDVLKIQMKAMSVLNKRDDAYDY